VIGEDADNRVQIYSKATVNELKGMKKEADVPNFRVLMRYFHNEKQGKI